MKNKRIMTLLLVLILSFCLGTSALAATSTTTTVPITLTVENLYRSVNVTVPASLPVYVVNGAVLTSDNAKITNNSKTGSVQVTAVEVKEGAYKIGDYDSFSGSKTLALKINNCATKGAGALKINKNDFPEIGAGQSLDLVYYAKVSGDAPNAKDVNAANVIFTIAITK